MANLKEAELLSIVNSKQVDAENNRNRIQSENEYLEKRYNAEYYGTEVPGRSRFVSNDVILRFWDFEYRWIYKNKTTEETISQRKKQIVVFSLRRIGFRRERNGSKAFKKPL